MSAFFALKLVIKYRYVAKDGKKASFVTECIFLNFEFRDPGVWGCKEKLWL